MRFIQPTSQDRQISRKLSLDSLPIPVARHQWLGCTVGFKDTKAVGVIGIGDAERSPVRSEIVFVVLALIGKGDRDGMIGAFRKSFGVLGLFKITLNGIRRSRAPISNE